MLEILILTLTIGIATLGSVLSIYGMRETAGMVKKCLNVALDFHVNIDRDVYESIAGARVHIVNTIVAGSGPRQNIMQLPSAKLLI